MNQKSEELGRKDVRGEKMVPGKGKKIKIPITIAGFIVLVTGIAVLLNGIFMTSPSELMIWGVILTVGILLIMIGVIAIHHGG